MPGVGNHYCWGIVWIAGPFGSQFCQAELEPTFKNGLPDYGLVAPHSWWTKCVIEVAPTAENPPNR